MNLENSFYEEKDTQNIMIEFYLKFRKTSFSSKWVFKIGLCKNYLA